MPRSECPNNPRCRYLPVRIGASNEGGPESSDELEDNNSELVERIFNVLDTDSSGTIDFREFVLGLNIMTRGGEAEKASILFDVYDVDGDQKISITELVAILHNGHAEMLELVSFCVRYSVHEKNATIAKVNARLWHE